MFSIMSIAIICLTMFRPLFLLAFIFVLDVSMAIASTGNLEEGSEETPTAVPECPPDSPCHAFGGRLIFRVIMNLGADGNLVCSSHGLICTGVPVLSPPNLACEAFFTTATSTTSDSGWRQSVWCNDNSGLACANKFNVCHDCPACSSGTLNCSTGATQLFSALFVECVSGDVFADGFEGMGNCDLLDSEGFCAAGEGCCIDSCSEASCTTSCAIAGSGLQGNACNQPTDCAAGLTCIDAGVGNQCFQMCDLGGPGGQYPFGLTCASFGIVVDDPEIGACI